MKEKRRLGARYDKLASSFRVATSRDHARTLVATAMVRGIIFGASIFVGFYLLQEGQTFVQELISGAGFSPYRVLASMMGLGMFLDWGASCCWRFRFSCR